MKRGNFKEKFNYWFDSIMQRGTATMILMLFIATMLVACIIGLLVSLLCGGTVEEGIWISLMHTLDGGTLAGDALDNKIHIFFMTLMTVFGLCFTGVLIGIINSSFEQKLYEMRKGTSKVIEKDHVVVLGFSYTLYTVIESLVDANENHRNQCIVIVGDHDIEEMKDAVDAHVKNFKGTKMVYRSGKIYEEHMLDCASVETAKAVIINGKNDVHAMKSLLTLKSYFKDHEVKPEPHISVVFNDARFVAAGELAAGENASIINCSDGISRIIAHASNQRGLCDVYEELLDYKQNEFYCEDVPEVVGKTFREVLFMFQQAIPVGIYHKNKTVDLNPRFSECIGKGDQLILFEEDDGAYRTGITSEPVISNIDESKIIKGNETKKMMMDLIILGQNHRLDDILREYDKITHDNATVKIVDTETELKYRLSEYKNIDLEYIQIDDFYAESLLEVLKGTEFNVLVLTDYDIDYEDADAKSLLKLIELKRIEHENGIKFATTCEIRKSANKVIAEKVGGENFVVSSMIGGLLSVQCSEYPPLYYVFKEILSSKGSELYMKAVEDFVELGVEVNFNTIVEAAACKDSICLGFRKVNPTTKKAELITCPDRDYTCTFNEGDTLIILSED
ncbi:Castor and Pollux, part of voltage-gated ion channel [Lachnospiraceae bacterium XBD2001]|nr:Castor and Pollux, part of voltage-gated ion channel [Lachnospiraceae bacterium XBD2001]